MKEGTTGKKLCVNYFHHHQTICIYFKSAAAISETEKLDNKLRTDTYNITVTK